MESDLLERRHVKFTLWIPAYPKDAPVPEIVIGTFAPGPPPKVDPVAQLPLVPAGKTDLWELDPKTIDPPLKDGQVYHYWFKAPDHWSPTKEPILVTDPLAYTTDYRLVSSRDSTVQPPAVIKYRDGKLFPCDLDGHEPKPVPIPAQEDLPENNHMVIYELPASWAKPQNEGPTAIDIGTFTDVLALFDKSVAGDRFKDIPAIANTSIVADLGVNAVELLPAADARPQGEWGYATAHYFAPDYDLGTSSELAALVTALHTRKTRLFTDVVMAFGHDPYVRLAFDQFHLDPRAETGNPDSYQSHTNQLRDGWGGSSWRYVKSTTTYDPLSGEVRGDVHPAWQFHRAHLRRWMRDFGVDGLRLDSVNNVASYDFLRAYKEDAWAIYRARYKGAAAEPSSAKFLVIGEELSVPLDMITTGSLNALWNEPFQGRLRSAILGETNEGDNFEWTVRKTVDCRLDHDHPFSDGAQAINYITSHDTEGPRKERLYDFLNNVGVTDIERRAKLAFAILLTSVGIPMIFAGDEFCDKHDRPMSAKQIDPVNYSRISDPWRARVFAYVSNLVKFRQACPALGENNTEFFHVDTSRGGKILAWRRGGYNAPPVVVIANFTGEDTPGGDYYVPNWPDRDRDDWREISQNRSVPKGWVGREPLKNWEAKIYTYWK